jgi:DNA-binding transcriptional ArsR family regulator
MARQPSYATLAVLEALLDAPGEMPDYVIASNVRGVGPRRVYRVLKRLEQDGWLHFRWEERQGERTKLIRLTGLGTLTSLHLLGGESEGIPPPLPDPSGGVERQPQVGPARFFDQDA